MLVSETPEKLQVILDLMVHASVVLVLVQPERRRHDEIGRRRAKGIRLRIPDRGVGGDDGIDPVGAYDVQNSVARKLSPS